MNSETFIELEYPMTKLEKFFRDLFKMDTGFEVRYYGEGTVVNDGIGPYEFWGAKCFDHGTDFLEFDEILIDEEGLTKKEVEIAEKYLEDNFDKVHLMLEESAEEPEYEEPPHGSEDAYRGGRSINKNDYR